MEHQSTRAVYFAIRSSPSLYQSNELLEPEMLNKQREVNEDVVVEAVVVEDTKPLQIKCRNSPIILFRKNANNKVNIEYFRMTRTFIPNNVIRALNKTKWRTGYEGRFSRNFEILDVREGWLKQRYHVQKSDADMNNNMHSGIIASLMLGYKMTTVL